MVRGVQAAPLLPPEALGVKDSCLHCDLWLLSALSVAFWGAQGWCHLPPTGGGSCQPDGQETAEQRGFLPGRSLAFLEFWVLLKRLEQRLPELLSLGIVLPLHTSQSLEYKKIPQPISGQDGCRKIESRWAEERLIMALGCQASGYPGAGGPGRASTPFRPCGGPHPLLSCLLSWFCSL